MLNKGNVECAINMKVDTNYKGGIGGENSGATH
jgi:hypothetical protein